MNLPYLFTWYDTPALPIPNTTNSLEGIISDLKKKVSVQKGEEVISLRNLVAGDFALDDFGKDAGHDFYIRITPILIRLHR